MELRFKKVHYNGKYEDGSKSVMAFEVTSALIDYYAGTIEWTNETGSQQAEFISYDKDIDYYTAIYEVSLNGEIIFEKENYLWELTDDEIKFAKADRLTKICTNWNELFNRLKW